MSDIAKAVGQRIRNYITILGIRLARRYIPILCGVRPLQFNRTVFKR